MNFYVKKIVKKYVIVFNAELALALVHYRLLAAKTRGKLYL